MQDLIEFTQQNVLLVGAFLGLLTVLIVSELKRMTRNYQEVSTSDAVRLMNDEDALVLDVRESKDIKAGVLSGAKNIPLKDLAKRITELTKYKDQQVLVYCDIGMKSGQACQQLNKSGFENVQMLRGGASAWVSDNLPLEKS